MIKRFQASFPWLVVAVLVCLLSEDASAGMVVQSLSGPVTPTEISSFESFMSGESAPTANTYNNEDADGTSGMEAEALGLMYQVTNNPAFLNQMIAYADRFLSLRNDRTSAANGGQRVMWDGHIDPVWLTYPTNVTDSGYAGCENNDIVGHIAFCARLIFETPSLWNTPVPDGDPYGTGTTYYQRAQTFLTQMDLTESNYMVKWFINPADDEIVAPASSAWTALGQSVNAWNRQMMFMNGFQRLSECHQLLGDNPSKVAQYDAIVRAAMNWFVSNLKPYTTNGITVYNWTYAPGSGGSEDNTLHSTYDIWGITRAWESGRYGLLNSTMIPFANTLQYVMNVSTNHISYYVNDTGSNSPRNYIYPGWMPIANFGAQTFPIMANMDIAQGSQASTAIFDAFILWVKNARYVGVFPTNTVSPDFTVSTPWIENVIAGSTVTCQVTVNQLNGFESAVSLQVGRLPAGITASFNPPSVSGGSGTSTLTLSASNAAPGGIYALTNSLTIYGTAGTGVRSVSIALVVKPQPSVLKTTIEGSNFLMTVTNGFPGATCCLLQAANLNLPLNQWTPVATNIFGMNGSFDSTNAINTSTRFFILRY
jgi:hypothetical protein